MARVGLGCLGVVAELSLQCVPSHHLLQRTQVMTRQQVHQQHRQLLQGNRHLRYMWLPYTDAVVVVTCNAYKEVGSQPTRRKGSDNEPHQGNAHQAVSSRRLSGRTRS